MAAALSIVSALFGGLGVFLLYLAATGSDSLAYAIVTLGVASGIVWAAKNR